MYKRAMNAVFRALPLLKSIVWGCSNVEITSSRNEFMMETYGFPLERERPSVYLYRNSSAAGRREAGNEEATRLRISDFLAHT